MVMLVRAIRFGQSDRAYVAELTLNNTADIWHFKITVGEALSQQGFVVLKPLLMMQQKIFMFKIIAADFDQMKDLLLITQLTHVKASA